VYLCLMRARIAEELAFLPGSSLYERLLEGGGGSYGKGERCCLLTLHLQLPAYATLRAPCIWDGRAPCLVKGDMTLVGAFITENARMARERCAAVCAALVQNVAALAALPGFEQQVPVCTVPQHMQ